MCGIFGTTSKYEEAVIKAKLQTMDHRGPDYCSFKSIDSRLIFGHNRLAIIDLDSRSNQPFIYENIEIVFNGEIYNFLDLKETLRAEGHVFNTSSDTEVVCASYLEFGTKCLDYLNGMFAFVIYDRAKNILFGARDRLGKKPFYYMFDDGEFEFASSLSAIECGKQLELNRESLTKYLYWNYIPEPHTPFQNVFKLPAGHSFVYDLGSTELKISKYWDLPVKNFVGNVSYEDAVKELDELLTDAVKIRMIADVPLGVFLSGGVDSSVVAAIAQKVSAVPVKTFSIKFNESGFDESAYARQVANLLKADHTEIECTYEEGINFIKNFSDFYDEPFADSSAIPSLLLSKYTSQNVTVALSGDGGDETFLGYNIYDIVQDRRKTFYIPLFVRKLISKVVKSIAKGDTRLNLIARGMLLKDIKAYYISYFKGLNNDWIEGKEGDVEYVEYLMSRKKPLLEAISDFDTKKYMNGDCITKVERASMAFSLEVRSPLMDYRIIEFARKIPTDFKYNNGIKKRILKDVLYNYLPEKIFDRRKAGFGMPLGVWFRTILKDYVLEMVSSENLKCIDSLIVKDEFLRIVDEHMEGKWDHTPKIWKVIVLINWLKKRGLKVN
ncbi:asparagine synthase (glutamine-hydrolyzing) [Daejeonella sp. JGW-45]|uniref:asparagine synthase (glutamine-hydrolyzing) n=1 Tax=Daejeonella sp. JGW-45 TaxID=3034148 RepID=UPI0023EB4C1D|nr:asparagine synthase (glutamine-hydrolyzing) [Daejeonella sp. JGW-45]